MKKYSILIEDDLGIRLAMDSKTGRAKMFKSKEHAQQYAKRQHYNLYQFIELSLQDYNKFISFYMAEQITL